MAAIPTASSEQHPPALRTFTQSVTQYRKRFNEKDEQAKAAAEAQREKRKANAAHMADEYYDFATQAFLSNWSPSFHYTPFSPQHQTLREAQTFYQHRLALFLQLQPTDLVLDVGCGIGGPALEIARLTGCTVIGVSINQRQINIAQAEARRQRLDGGNDDYNDVDVDDDEDDDDDDDDYDDDGTSTGSSSGKCTFIRADFCSLPFPDNTFDAAFAIEATCHSADLSAVYKEIARVVKKNGKRNNCAISEWVLTPAFDATNPEHVRVRHRIERGNGLASLPTLAEADCAFRAAGFHMTHSENFARHFDYAYHGPAHPNRQLLLQLPLPPPPLPPPPKYRPWYQPLDGTLSSTTLSSSLADVWRTVKLHPLFYHISYAIVSLLQIIGLYPQGVTEAMETMKDAVEGVREGGELGILSPAWWFVGTCASVLDVEGSS